MSRQLNGKSQGEASEASHLSLLVHAADSQTSSGKGGRKNAYNGGSQREEAKFRVPDRAPTSATLEERLAQRQNLSRLDSLSHQGLLSQLRGGALGDDDLLSGQYGGTPYAALLAAQQQQQQQAALAFANDIRTAFAAAQMQNQDPLFARTNALRQLEALGGAPGNMDQIQHELDRQRLEELERRQFLAAAAGGDPLASLAARRQLELQTEHQLRQQQLGRQLAEQNGESLLARAGSRVAAESAGASSAANKAKSKAAFQKTPGSVVVPCRARGMPMDHNFKTAYFVIPEKVKHGEELICSYFACRNAGIKFRFCTHCKVPVAKRNFRKRHRHGMPSNAEADDDVSVEDEEETMQKPAKKIQKVSSKPKETVQTYQEAPKKVEVEKKKKKPEKIEQKLRENASAGISDNEESAASGVQENSKNEESRPVSKDTGAKDPVSISQKNRSKISAEREQLWAAMLAKRPPTKDGDAVSAWLMEVLSVSDLGTPLKENGQVDRAANATVSLPFSTKSLKDTAPESPEKAEEPKKAEEIAESPAESAEEQDKSKGEDDNKDNEKDNENTEPEESSDSEMSEKADEPPVTKKRQLAEVEESKSDKDDSSAEPSPAKPTNKNVGSFAEWKDRKKHKGLPKKGYSIKEEN